MSKERPEHILAKGPEIDELERQRVRADARRLIFGGEVPPTTLGRFELRGHVGAGGMGVIYEGYDPKLDRRVALKVVGAGQSEEASARLEREAQALAKLSHPNVVAVHDVGRDDGRVFIAMELVEGVTLDRWIAEAKPEREVIAGVLRDVGRGLAAAHERGVVHRDFKPANVLVTPEGQGKVVDFGLARASGVEGLPPEAQLRTLTRTGAFAGTPAYAAPEQLRGEAIDARSDVFSFCLTAYEALTGGAPFEGETIAERLREVEAQEVAANDFLTRALKRGLAADPAERWNSMSALLDAMSTSRAPPRRRWGWAAAAALAGGAVAAIGLRPDEPEAPPMELTADRGVLACPLLEASGVEEPTGWLGAAAASLACRRMTWLLGGVESRTLVPAELLDVPRQHTESFPADPYVEPEARARSLEAARSRSQAWLDGSVRRDGGRFRISLRLMDAHGERVAGEGEGTELHQTVRAAVESLSSSGKLPVAAAVDSAVDRWRFVRQPTDGMYLDDLWSALRTSLDGDGLCDDLDAKKLGAASKRARALCGTFVSGLETAKPGAVDRTTPAAFALSVSTGATSESPVAADLAELRRKESTPLGRGELALAEGRARVRIGEHEQAQAVFLAALADTPRSWDLHREVILAANRPSEAVIAVRAFAAWAPGNPDSWRLLGSYWKDFDPKMRAQLKRRAYELGPRIPQNGTTLVGTLLRAKRIEEARSIGAAFASGGSELRFAGAYSLGLVDSHEARFGQALSRLEEALEGGDSMGQGSNSDMAALIHGMRVAELLGRLEDFATRFAKRYVPDRIVLPENLVPLVPALCMHAAEEEAIRCIESFRELREKDLGKREVNVGEKAFEAGALEWARRNAAGAAAAWRPLVEDVEYYIYLPSEVFDAAAEVEIASKLDTRRIAEQPHQAGIDLSWAREAKRAHTRGDLARARKLAKGVVKAWSVADVPVPAVAEMKELLEGLEN